MLGVGKMTRLDYKTCSTLCFLHEHKRAYQPNLLRAILLISIASTIAAIGIRLLVQAPEIIENADAEQQADGLEFGAADQSGADTKSTGGYVDFLPPAYRDHEGFAGFEGYMVLPESHPTAELSTFDPTEYTSISPDVDFAAVRIGSTDATLPLYGTGDDCGDGLPGAMTFLDMNLPKRHGEHWRFPGIANGTPTGDGRHAPILQFANVRYPQKGKFIDGRVMMIVDADRAGRLKDIEVISEEPSGHDFAEAVKDALDRSLYWPPVVDGEKVPYRFQLTYDFCWACRRQSTVEVVSGDMIVAGPVRTSFQTER